MSPQRPPAPRPGRRTPGGRPSPPRAAGGRPGPADEPPASAPTARVPGTPQPGGRARPPRTGGRTRTGQPSEASTTGRGEAPRAQTGPTRVASTATGPTRTVTTYTVGRFSGPVRPQVVSTRSAERFEERARARRNLARRQVLTWAGAVVGAGGLGWLLFGSPVLALDATQVEVSGAGTVVAVDQVLAVVGAQAGTPLPRLDTVGLRDRVLEVPGVREARVVRQWPHGLAVQLVSREPVAAVPEPVPATGLVLLDEQGVQVGRADTAPPGLPVVDVPVGEERTLSAVLRVLEQLPPDLLAQVGSVAARTQDTVSLQLRDGPRVEWGSADETPLKIAVLGALRAAPAAEGASVFDVSAPRMPITR